MEWLRWPDGFVCPGCSHAGGWRIADGRFECAACASRTSPTAGTVFDRTRTPLTVWFTAFAATEEQNRQAILALLPAGRGGELLDVGTSDGAFTLRVGERLGVSRSAGVELIPEHADAARARVVDAVMADVEQGLPFEDGRFATVHANQVIEHLRHTDRFLAEVRRVLAPGGLACISTNNLSLRHGAVRGGGLSPD